MRYDAKNWAEFLELNGFSRVPDNTAKVGYYNHPYVGMAPDEGEYGQLYWFESRRWDSKDHRGSMGIYLLCPTFENFQPVIKRIDAKRSDIIWYELFRDARRS